MYRSERIRELREARALTQTEVAKRVHTTQPTVSRIEKGEIKERPDRALALRLARLFDVPLSEVWQEEQPDATEDPPEDRQSGDVYSTVPPFEAAVLRVVDPSVHTIADLHAATAAWAAASKASGLARDPALVARLWLDAARSLRADGLLATPDAVVARVALRDTA